MRHVAAMSLVAGVIVIAGCGGSQQTPSRATTPTPLIPRPVVERELDSLLLTAAQVNPLLGASGMTVVRRRDAMSDDSATMRPRECLAVDGSVQAQTYAGSGFSGMRDQELNDGDNFAHFAQQAVVLFPTVKQAHIFVVASALRWPGCHQYTHIQSQTRWDVGPVSDDSDVLSATSTQQEAKTGGWACGRALTARNNVVVDVNTCSANPANSAIDIANQIVAKIVSR